MEEVVLVIVVDGVDQEVTVSGPSAAVMLVVETLGDVAEVQTEEGS